METTEVIIARLVLGYLKGEKCKSAYKEFLRTSNTLQGDVTFAKSKYIPTRFVGLTLEDILSEYFEIYKIVQGRLEATNYYNEFHSKTSLVQQLLYLLHKINSSRTSTPCPRSPLESNLDDTSPSQIDHISDVETTPADTLPGNVRCTSEDSYLHKSPKRQSQLKLSKSSTLSNLPDIDKEDMSEVLAQTLLENREFQEKIAQTINKVAEKQYKVSAELDKTIKTVVRETEEDPIFDRILEEIIGATTINDNNKAVESINTISSFSCGKNTNEDTGNRSKKTCNYSNSDSSEHRDQSSKTHLESQTVEEQNNEAICSIVANANLGKNVQGNSHLSTNNQDNVIAGEGNNEVIVFDGSLDKYLISNTCNATTQTQVVQNPLYINNTGGLLMVPSNITTNVAGNLHIDSSKQYYFVNKQPSMNWTIPKIKTPNVITEQDILAMPTVIVNDGIPTQSVLQTPVSTRVQTPVVTTILPKPTIEVPSSLGEYLTFYSAKEPQPNGLKKVIYPKKPKCAVNASRTSDSTVTMTSIINSTKENKSLPTELFIDPSPKDANENKSLPTELLTDVPSKDTVLQTHEQDFSKPQLSKNEHAPKTPAPPEQVQKVTPKSGSHVRNLDFSTPPKITSTHKKSMKSNQVHKTPLFMHKKQAAKALFPSQDVESTNTDLKLKENDTESKTKTRKLTGAWDADLRSVIAPAGDIKNQTPKRKRKSPLPKIKKKKTKKASIRVNPQLNTTVEDAALLEAALKSPVKPDTDNSQIVDSSIKENNKEDDKIKENICTSKREQKKSNSSSNSTNEVPSKSTDIKSEKTVESMHLEKADDNSTKMILSPSKLKASKRNLLNTDIVPSDVINKSDLRIVEGKNKYVTPEMIKEAIQLPIKANRNITPMLETPIKHMYIPKTPSLQTPVNPSVDLNISLSNSVFTPFSKMLEANLKDIDINSLPTPNIPITPSFPPFTPTVDLASPYSNRPTDYSTSSSYYQPSDSEQNRSLEANVKEIEKKPVKVLSNELIVPDNGETNQNEKKNGKSHLAHPTVVNEHLNIFNKNVIGKKNLNLMKRNVSSSSSSSDDTTSNSSSEEEENSDSCQWNEKESNDTIIYNKKVTETPRRTYLLRNRSTVAKDKEELHKSPIAPKDVTIDKRQTSKDKKPKGVSSTNSKQCSKESKPLSKPEKNIPIKAEKAKETSNTVVKEGSTKSEEISTLRQAVLRELEEKRLRMINKIKNENGSQKKSSSKPPVRPNAKFMKIKPIPNLTNSKRKPRKSDSPKKSLPNKPVKITDKVFDNSKNDNDKSKIISCDGIFQDKSTSDVEAQNLIEGLKERGIHLMHNKSSPNKKLDVIPVDTNLENRSCEQFGSTDLIKSTSGDTENNCNTTVDIKNSSELQKNELSTSLLESELRDTYDVRVFDKYECVVFDESKTITKTFEDYNTKVLEKKFIGKVFIEEINEEIDVSLSFSPFYTLLDLQPTEDLLCPKQNQNSQKVNDKTSQLENKGMKKDGDKNNSDGKEEISLTKDIIPAVSDELTKSDDDLMNYAIVGSLREENPEGSESPKSIRKRKLWNEENSHTEKKCKTLLKQINVESFLNNIHGGS